MSDVRVLDPADTLQAYDRWSETYDRQDNPLVAATGRVLDQAPLGCAGLEVVELGCGTGRHAPRILAEGARRYLGIDGSPGMLAQARRRIDDPRVEWLEAEIGALPHTPPSDLALMVLVLEHLPELDTVSSALASLLRPGGRLRILDIHPEILGGGTVAHYREGSTEVRFASVAHPPQTLVSALDRAGLSLVRRRDWPADKAIPRLAKHAGRPVVLDLEAVRR